MPIPLTVPHWQFPRTPRGGTDRALAVSRLQTMRDMFLTEGLQSIGNRLELLRRYSRARAGAGPSTGACVALRFQAGREEAGHQPCHRSEEAGAESHQ